MTETKASGGGLARHGAVMAAGSLVSRITGFARTVVISAALGSTVLGNSYITAQYFPQMIYELVLGGVLTSVLIPLIVRARKNDDDGGEAYTHRLMTLCVLLLAGATACLVAAAPLLAALAGGEANRDVITSLSYFMLPAIFFYGLCALLQAVLNTRDHFAAPMWAPIVNNIVVIAVGVTFFALYTSRNGALAGGEVSTGMVLLLGLGTLSGILFQALSLLPMLRKVQFRWKWRFDFHRLQLRKIAKLGGWIFCYVALNQVSMMVLIKVANLSADNSPRADAQLGPMIYNNAYLIMMMAHGIVAVSIITAFMPRLSAAADDERHADMAEDLSTGTRMATLLLTPIAVAYVVLGTPLAVLLFEWGAFGTEAAGATGVVIAVAGLSLVPFAVSQLQIFAFYAMTDAKTVALINIPVVALRIAAGVLSLLLLPVEYAVAGLMAANGLSYVLAIVLSTVYLRRRIGALGVRRIATSWGKQLAAAAAAAAAVLGALAVLPGVDAGRLPQLWVLAAGGTVLLAVYFAVSYLLRMEETTQAVRMVRAKLGR